MKKSRFKRNLMLVVVLVAVILTEPVLASRQGRKSSTSRSSSRGSASRQSSRSNSNRVSPSSRPSISTRSIPRPNSSISRRTNRSSTRIDIGNRTNPNTRSIRFYSPDTSPSNMNTSSFRNSSGRPSRRSDSPVSSPGSSTDGDRTSRTTVYHEYPSTRRSYYHYHHDYYPSHRIFYWISWPDCCRPICYDWGPSFTFSYFWPYYHRRFVFVSLGGYWPCYTYRRYYWYGWHPYCWYGYFPPDYLITGSTYNYYYYSTAPQGEELEEAQKKLEKDVPAKPAEETQGDRDFEAGVKAFDAGDYNEATAKFHNAMQLAPEDIVVPFAHVQALFASGQYQNAAEALREALLKSSPQQEGVFYPRGLYSDESVLTRQIEQLTEVVERDPLNARMRLLLGYQLLGTGKLDEAAVHLENARLNSNTNQAASLLIDILKKNSKNQDNQTNSTQEQPEKSEEPTPTDSKDKISVKHDIDLSTLAIAADKWIDE